MPKNKTSLLEKKGRSQKDFAICKAFDSPFSRRKDLKA